MHAQSLNLKLHPRLYDPIFKPKWPHPHHQSASYHPSHLSHSPLYLSIYYLSNHSNMATKPTVKVSPVTSATDLARFFDVTASALAAQARDGFFMAMNPGWDTPEGRAAGAERLARRFESSSSSTARDRNGDPTTVFLKATVDDPASPNSGKEVIAGAAIWVQASMVDGYGEKPVTDLAEAMDLNELYPGDESQHAFLRQVDASLHGRRVEVVKEIAGSASPAVFALDLCVVDPAFQRRGIASQLVRWGLEEAKRRGGIEAVLEASSMGRHVYGQLGFEQEGGEIVYDVDERFRGRDLPSNVFMRTGRPQ